MILKQKRYQPSDMGRLVSNFLNTSFSEYVNDEFTSKMEDNLDAISSGTKTKTEVLDQFWQPLIEGIDKVSATVTRKDVNPQRPLGQHPESEKPMFARMTKNGPAVQIGDIDADDEDLSFRIVGDLPKVGSPFNIFASISATDNKLVRRP